MTRTPAYSASKKFSTPTSRNGSHSKLDPEDDDLELVPPPVAFPTTGYSKIGSTSKTLAATNGLGKAPAPPKAVFNPDKEGALVMPRPHEAHQKQYNQKGYPIVDVVVDPALTARLREHQRE